MAEPQKELNELLLEVFADALKAEMQAVQDGGVHEISLKDVHIIKNICTAQNQRERRTTAVAQRVGITAGTLTVAINGLVKKGYVERAHDPDDRRAVILSPTDKALHALRIHDDFHRCFIDEIDRMLSDEERAVLIKTLHIIKKHLQIED